MIEEEWLTPGDLKQHIDLVRENVRRLRLFGVACCRPLEPWMYSSVMRDALLRAEQYADGEVRESTMRKWRQQLNRAEMERWKNLKKGTDAASPERATYHAVRWVCHEYSGPFVADPWQVLVLNGLTFGGEVARRGPVVAHALLLDIFGNPFRPVTFSPDWRTDTAVTLARTMYDSREFGAMPILADALQDAGCDNDAILSHCRDTTLTHVRGCWVVDLVLNKA